MSEWTRQRSLHWVVGFVGLALATNALFPWLAQSHRDISAAPTTTRSTLIALAVDLYALVVVLRRRDLARYALRSNPALLALMLVLALSTGWSSDPRLTAYRLCVLTGGTVFALFLSVTFSARDLLVLVSRVLLAIVAIGIVAALFAPSEGLDALRNNSWRGIFVTKNEFGRIAALGLVVWVVRTSTEPYRRRLLGTLAATACAVAAWKADSRSAIFVLLVVLAVFAIRPILRLERNMRVAGLAFAAAGVVSVASWVIPNASALTFAVGADPTLTGRRAIWSAVGDAIRQHPWLGYGYDAFWRSGGPAVSVWSRVPSLPPHSHDGFLDVWLEVGIIGLLLTVSFMLLTAKRAVHAVRATQLGGIFPLVVVAYLAAYNVTESTLVPRATFFWLLFIALAFIMPLDNDVRMRPALRSTSTMPDAQVPKNP